MVAQVKSGAGATSAPAGAPSSLPKANMAAPAAVSIAPSGQPDAAAKAGLAALLKFEQAAREAETVDALLALAANEARQLARARQVFMVASVRGSTKPIVRAVSSISQVDRQAPLLQMVERIARPMLRAAQADGRSGGAREYRLDGLVDRARDGGIADTYPMRELIFVPIFSRQGRLFGGLVLAREIAWREADMIIAKRIAGTVGHAWQALDPRLGRRARFGRRWLWGLTAVASLAALMLIPVPMSGLAPFEIVPREPVVVAAPIAGVIDAVVVEPNAKVAKGDVLVRFNDIELRNKFDVAARELRVAEARLKRASQLSFSTLDGRRELAIAAAERDVRVVERDFARDMLAKANIRADRDGIAVFADKKDLVGKPVKTGERLMQLADPQRVFVHMNVPVSDVALLETGADVRLYLDSDPLNPVKAKLVRADYEARAHTGDTVSFRAWAEIVPGGDGAVAALPRFGARGTAQVFGDDVALGLYLFRRPITAVRQWLGL